MDMIETVFTILFGLVIGSFLSVCIYRLPIGRFDALDDEGEAIPSEKEKLSIFYPSRSFCPKCNNQLKWYHNVPLISWILLGGKCAFCKEKIPFRYPLVEILSALCAYLSFHYYGISLEAFIIYAFSASLIVMSFIDIDYFILPNLINYPASIIGIILVVTNHFYKFLEPPFCQSIKDMLIGLLGAISLYVVASIHAYLRKKEGLGFGDIKLLVVIGIFFGWQASFFTIFIGSLLAIICTVFISIFKRNALNSPLPFGPYLSLGCVAYLFYFAFNGL